MRLLPRSAIPTDLPMPRDIRVLLLLTAHSTITRIRRMTAVLNCIHLDRSRLNQRAGPCCSGEVYDLILIDYSLPVMRLVAP
jgi:hypothetical protein